MLAPSPAHSPLHDARPQWVPRLLLVEGDPDTALAAARTLRHRFGEGAVTHCRCIAHAQALDVYHFDLVVIAMCLPDGSGLHLLGNLLSRRPDLPVILLANENVLETAITAIRRGAYDYLAKTGDYLFTLPLLVEKNLAIHRIQQENLCLHVQLAQSLEQVRVKNAQLERAVRELETTAATDPLTGLLNRRAFNQALDTAFHDAKRLGHDLACIMIDLDHFKQLNDTHGHRRGDQVLQHAARVLQAHCRQSDVACRFGGDEFILLLPRTDRPAASLVAGRIAEQYNSSQFRALREDDPMSYAGEGLVTTMSLGLATLNESPARRPDHLIDQADRALYRAKQAGRIRLMIHACA